MQIFIGWNESDLVDFIGVTLPAELKSDLKEAGPLLYRCFRRLGSFPFHNQPLQAQCLNFETFATAVVIFLRRHESYNGFPFGRDSSHDIARCRDEWMQRLLFQCMSVAPDPREQSEVGDFIVADISDLSTDDDTHLRQAYKLVEDCNTWISDEDEKIGFSGPPIIKMTALPSSKSEDFRGSIPKNEFQSLLNILLASQLYLSGYGPEGLCRVGETLSIVTTNVVNAISQFRDVSGITWGHLNSAFATTIVCHI